MSQNAKQACIKLIELIKQTTSSSTNEPTKKRQLNKTYSITSVKSEVEMARKGKFSQVTSREQQQQQLNHNDNMNRPDLTQCQKDMLFTFIENQQEENSNFNFTKQDLTVLQQDKKTTIDSNQFDYSTTLVSDDNGRSMRRSTARINLYPQQQQQQSLAVDTSSSRMTNEGESIISTAEEHIKSRLQPVKLKDIKPKLTSSTLSLANLINKKDESKTVKLVQQHQQEQQQITMENSTITFNVDFASTPKKIIPRSSTPRVCKQVKRKSVKQPITSTFISIHRPKTIVPPPLLSSSLQSSDSSDCKIQRTEKVKCNICLLNKKKTRKCCKRSSTRIDCKLSKKHANKRHHHHHNKKQQRQMESDETPSFMASTFKQEYQQSSILPSVQNLKSNLKYPIKYVPNMKTQDIDRLSNLEDLCWCPSTQSTSNAFDYNNMNHHHHHNLQPIINNCYVYGDYKFWII